MGQCIPSRTISPLVDSTFNRNAIIRNHLMTRLLLFGYTHTIIILYRCRLFVVYSNVFSSCMSSHPSIFSIPLSRAYSLVLLAFCQRNACYPILCVLVQVFTCIKCFIQHLSPECKEKETILF